MQLSRRLPLRYSVQNGWCWGIPEVADVDSMLPLMREFGMTALAEQAERWCWMPLRPSARTRNRSSHARKHSLGAAAGRFGSAASMPGGCAIGARRSTCISRHWVRAGAEVDMDSVVHVQNQG
jgi:UDP-N-acetylglucosamine enolpyruvyl transferase